MVVQVSARTQRLARLSALLETMPQETLEEIRKAIGESAEAIVAQAKSMCPADSGDLRASIGWTWGEAPAGSEILAVTSRGFARRGSGLTATIYAGSDKAYYARWVEFGTQAGITGGRATNKRGKTRKVLRTHPGAKAQPFFFPAYRANVKKAIRNIRAAVRAAARREIQGV